MVPFALAFIGDVIPYERRQQVIGTFLSGQILGQMFSQAAGGILGDYFGWRTVFFMLAGHRTRLCRHRPVHRVVAQILSRAASKPCADAPKRRFHRRQQSGAALAVEPNSHCSRFHRSRRDLRRFCFRRRRSARAFRLKLQSRRPVRRFLRRRRFDLQADRALSVRARWSKCLGPAGLASRRRHGARRSLRHSCRRACCLARACRHFWRGPRLLHAAQHATDQRDADDAGSARHRRRPFLGWTLSRTDDGLCRLWICVRPLYRRAGVSRLAAAILCWRRGFIFQGS